MTPEQVILLVEDNDDDAELALMAFSRARVTNPIVRTRDGMEGIDYLLGRGDHAGRDPSDVPAVVLLDLNLPRIDGITVLRTIRGDDLIKHVPVVVFTSSNEDSDRLAAYDHHANSFVRKPVDYDQFVEVARQLCLYWLALNSPAPRRG